MPQLSDPSQPFLFPPDALPEAAIPVSEASQEWMDAQLLQIIEGVRFNPERLVAYEAKVPTGRQFLDFVLERLGGRSQ